MERTTKLVLAFHVDKRTPWATTNFAAKLKDATSGRFQLSTDGFRTYRTAIPLVFGNTIDFAQIVKTYGNSPEVGTASRYSPGEVTAVHTVVIIGNPDDDRVSISHAERQNLSIRMGVRRMTRLTNAHSKKWENHKAALVRLLQLLPGSHDAHQFDPSGSRTEAKDDASDGFGADGSCVECGRTA